MNSDFDLNSLIEGVVDDESETETLPDELGSIERASLSKSKVVRYLEPLKVKV